MYCAAFFAAVTLVSATSRLPQTEQTKSSECGSYGSCTEGDTGIDDYTSVLQVSLSVDKKRGTSKSSDYQADHAQGGVDSITPNPEAQVEEATFDETMVVLGKAGDASFHRWQTSFHTGVQGFWKRVAHEPHRSSFDTFASLFVFAAVTSSVVACTLLAIRGKASKSGRPRRCSALSRLFKVKPETVTRVAPPLPAFHPAKQLCDGGSSPSSFSRLPYIQSTDFGKQQQRACSHNVPMTAEQILQEAERQAQVYAEKKSTTAAGDKKTSTAYELKSPVELEVASHR